MTNVHQLMQCCYCKDSLDATNTRYYRRGLAWFRSNPSNAYGHTEGTNRGTQVQWTSVYCCITCMGKKMKGIPVEQMELFHLDYPSE